MSIFGVERKAPGSSTRSNGMGLDDGRARGWLKMGPQATTTTAGLPPNAVS